MAPEMVELVHYAVDEVTKGIFFGFVVLGCATFFGLLFGGASFHVPSSFTVRLDNNYGTDFHVKVKESEERGW